MCNLKRGAACIVLLGGNSAPSGNSGDDVPSSQAPNLAGIMRTFRVLSSFLDALASLGFKLSQTKKIILLFSPRASANVLFLLFYIFS